MFSLSPAKLLVLAVLALLVLGPDKLPGMARQIGAAWGGFRRFQEKMEADVRESFPDLPSTQDIARAARSPVSFLNSLADLPSDGQPDERSTGIPDGAAVSEGLGAPDGAQQAAPVDVAPSISPEPAPPAGPPEPAQRPAADGTPTGPPPGDRPRPDPSGPVVAHQLRPMVPGETGALSVPDDPSLN